MKRFLSALLLLTLLLPLGGCFQENNPCPEPDDTGQGNVYMSFRIVASNSSGTRADDQGHPEEGDEFLPVENDISVGDFAFFIFVGEGSDAKLLTKVNNIFGNDDKITGAQGIYTINLEFTPEQIKAVFGREFDPSSNAAVSLRAVTFANSYSSDPANSVNNLTAVEGTTTYGEFMAQAYEMAVGLSGNLYEASPGASSVDRLNFDSGADGMYKGFIPMFANKLFTTTEADLCRSRHDDSVWLGETWLLRAVAKVRVEDNIQNRDAATGYPRIAAADIVVMNSVAYQLLFNAQEYKDGWQVHTPHIYPDNANPMTFQLGYLPADEGKDVKPVRLGYVSEQQITAAQPMIRVRIAYDERIVHDRTFSIPMSGDYEGQPLNFGDNILRNHVYTLSVNRAETGIPAEITVKVGDWVEQPPYNLDYSDNVGVSEYLSWTAGSYQSLDNVTGQLVLKPWSTVQSPAECSFGINTPVGASWTASLITTAGTQGAFRFLDADNNPVQTVGGTISGTTLQTLKIVSVDPTPTVLSSARLQVIVRLGNGKYIEAPLVNPNLSFKNYTIIQNPQ